MIFRESERPEITTLSIYIILGSYSQWRFFKTLLHFTTLFDGGSFVSNSFEVMNCMGLKGHTPTMFGTQSP